MHLIMKLKVHLRQKWQAVSCWCDHAVDFGLRSQGEAKSHFLMT